MSLRLSKILCQIFAITHLILFFMTGFWLNALICITEDELDKLFYSIEAVLMDLVRADVKHAKLVGARIFNFYGDTRPG